jgi:hypothetical protein
MSREGNRQGSPPAPRGRADVSLGPETVEAIARRVEELLARRFSQTGRTAPRRLLTAAEISEWWGVERSWVYDHAEELGAIRLGTGRRPRLRFDPDLVAQRLDARATKRRPPTPGRRRNARRSPRTPADPVDLLPLKGEPELRSSTAKKGRPGGAQTPPAAAPKAKAPAR